MTVYVLKVREGKQCRSVGKRARPLLMNDKIIKYTLHMYCTAEYILRGYKTDGLITCSPISESVIEKTIQVEIYQRKNIVF